MTSKGESEDAPVRVAVDAMGGDHAPEEVIAGAVEAAREDGTAILLVGPPEAVRAELEKHDASQLPVTVIPSEGPVEESEQPALALRRRPHASIAVATNLVKEGKADAVVSVGSTGATMAAAFFSFGLVEGLERPVLGGPFLGYTPQVITVDMGINVEARPAQFLDFAAIGVAVARSYAGVPDPTVALLNVGAEESKGTKQVREAYELLKNSNFKFIGNVEAHEVIQAKANVVLCDGFVGNVMLKTAEGLAEVVAKDVGRQLLAHLPMEDAQRIGRDLYRKMSVLDSSGAPVLGVNGIAIVGHGRARASAVRGAIQSAVAMRRTGTIDAVQQELAKVHRDVAQV